IAQGTPDERFVAKERRCRRCMRLRAEPALVLIRGVRRNQLAKGRADRGRLPQHPVRKTREVDGEVLLERKEIPDLRVLGASRRRRPDQILVDAGLRARLDAGKVERWHGVHLVLPDAALLSARVAEGGTYP